MLGGGNKKEGVQKVFGTLDLFVSLLETEIKYPILQGGILPFWTPSSNTDSYRLITRSDRNINDNHNVMTRYNFISNQKTIRSRKRKSVF